eukprot:8765187-Heterocapsa_arctica.AAC.1
MAVVLLTTRRTLSPGWVLKIFTPRKAESFPSSGLTTDMSSPSVATPMDLPLMGVFTGMVLR